MYLSDMLGRPDRDMAVRSSLAVLELMKTFNRGHFRTRALQTLNHLQYSLVVTGMTGTGTVPELYLSGLVWPCLVWPGATDATGVSRLGPSFLPFNVLGPPHEGRRQVRGVYLPQVCWYRMGCRAKVQSKRMMRRRSLEHDAALCRGAPNHT